MSDKSQFKIASYNIEYAAKRENILKNIVQMAEEGADILCLQEIIRTPHEEFFIDVLLRQLGDSWQAVYHVGEEEGRLSLGNAIIWNQEKFSLKSSEKILLPLIKKFDMHEKLWYKTIGVPNTPIQRRTVSCLFTFNNRPIRITSAHIDNVGGPRHRMKQIAFLISKLRSFESALQEIICGDFNTFDLLKLGYEKKLLQRELGEEFVDASNGIKWTSDIYMIDFKTSIWLLPWVIKTFKLHIRRRLDYIWTKNLKIVTCNKIELEGSDHYPIVAELECW